MVIKKITSLLLTVILLAPSRTVYGNDSIISGAVSGATQPPTTQEETAQPIVADNSKLESLILDLNSYKDKLDKIDFTPIEPFKDDKGFLIGTIFQLKEKVQLKDDDKNEETPAPTGTLKVYKYKDDTNDVNLLEDNSLPDLHKIKEKLLKAEFESLKLTDDLFKSLNLSQDINYKNIEQVIIAEDKVSVKYLEDSNLVTLKVLPESATQTQKDSIATLYKYQNDYEKLFQLAFPKGVTGDSSPNDNLNLKQSFKYYSPIKTIIKFGTEEQPQYAFYSPNFSHNKDVFKSIIFKAFDVETIQQEFKIKYNCEMDITKSEENFQPQFLEEWRNEDGNLLLAYLGLLQDATKYYNDFGSIEQLNSYIEELNKFITNVNTKFNTVIPLLSSGSQNNTIKDINDYTSYGLVRDLFKTTDNGFNTNEIYNELIAWTGSFIPFETNVYDASGQMDVLSRKAQTVWNTYSKYRQPLAITLDTANGYEPILSASPRKLQYVTLEEYISRTLKGQDIFLFVNSITSEEIKRASSSEVNITNNIKVEGQEDSSSLQEQTPTPQTPQEQTQESTQQVSTQVNQQYVDNSWITSNPRFFGPVYSSSINNKVNYKTFRKLDLHYAQNHTDTINKEVVESLLNGSTNSLNVNGIHSLESIREKEDGSEDKVKINIDNQTLSSFILRNASPYALTYNHVLMYNTLQNLTYTREVIDKDMSNLLYMDFLGNIITESGYVVVPAVTNATSYKSLDSYPMFTAMWINSYPNVNITSKGKYSTSDRDKEKYILFFSKNTWFKAHMEDNEEVEDSSTSSSNPIWSARDNAGLDYAQGWFFGKLNKNGDGFTEEHSVKAPRLDTPILSDKITADTVIVESEEQSQAVGISADVPDMNREKYRDYPDDTEIIDMMTPSNILYINENYGIFGWGKHNFYIYNWVNSSPTVNTKIGDTLGTAYLSKIPSTLISYETGAITNLINDKITFYQEQDKPVFNLDIILSIVASLHNGSASTEVYDFTFVDYKSKIKEDSLNYLFGNLLESVYSPFVGNINSNLLTYLPTMNNLEVFDNYVPSFTRYLILLTVILVVVIFIITMTSAQRNDTLDMWDIVKSFTLTILICMFTIKGLPTTLDVIFQKPSNYILTNQNLLMVLNEYENQYKTINNTFFSENPKAFKSNTSIILAKISKEQAKQFRESEERPEHRQLFYFPQYDNSKQYVMGKIYLQGLYLKLDVIDLLNATSVESVIGNDLSMEYVQTTSSGSDVLTYYMPYNHFVESVTEMINTYSTVSSNYYTVLKYSNGYSKTTGRVGSYINSIFFIEPESIKEYLDTILSRQDAIDVKLDNTNGQEDLPYFKLEDGTEIKITKEMAKALGYIQDSLGGDTRDWLGLKNILYLSQDNPSSPFLPEFQASTMETKWYPEFKYADMEQVEEMIYDVNDRVKKFVMDYLTPIADTVSDEALIKIISLKATLEYNKEFNSLSRGRLETDLKNSLPKFINLYPVEIDGHSGNNDFYSKLIYMPLADLYLGTGESISYYLASEMELTGLILVFIDRLLFIFRFLVKVVFFIVLLISLIAYFLAYLMNSKLTKTYLKPVLLYSMIITLPLYLLEIVLFRFEMYMASKLALNIQLMVVLTISVVLTILQVLMIKLSYPSLKNLTLKVKDEIVNLFSSNNRASRAYSSLVDSSERDFSEMPENYLPPSEEIYRDSYDGFTEDFLTLDNLSPTKSEATYPQHQQEPDIFDMQSLEPMNIHKPQEHQNSQEPHSKAIPQETPQQELSQPHLNIELTFPPQTPPTQQPTTTSSSHSPQPPSSQQPNPHSPQNSASPSTTKQPQGVSVKLQSEQPTKPSTKQNLASPLDTKQPQNSTPKNPSSFLDLSSQFKNDTTSQNNKTKFTNPENKNPEKPTQKQTLPKIEDL